MSSDFSEIASLMGQPGVTIMKFCGVSVDEDNICDQEAVGEILADLGDGATVPVPVCEPHLEAIIKEFEVEELNI